jgi:hypothetical protein
MRNMSKPNVPAAEAALAEGRQVPAARPGTDPILETIDLHQYLVRGIEFASRPVGGERETPAAMVERQCALTKWFYLEGYVLGMLLHRAPLTLAGMVAVLRYVAAFEDEDYLSALVASLLKSSPPAN